MQILEIAPHKLQLQWKGEIWKGERGLENKTDKWYDELRMTDLWEVTTVEKNGRKARRLENENKGGAIEGMSD